MRILLVLDRLLDRIVPLCGSGKSSDVPSGSAYIRFVRLGKFRLFSRFGSLEFVSEDCLRLLRVWLCGADLAFGGTSKAVDFVVA